MRRFPILSAVSCSVVLACLAAMLAGCTKEAPAEANLRSHRNVAAGYALDVPQDWTVAESTDKGEAFARTLPDGKGKLVVVVRVESATGIRTVEEYLQSSREQLSRRRGYDELDARVAQHASGRRGYVIDAVSSVEMPSGEMPGELASERRRFRQWGFLLDGKQYLITAMVPATEGDRWMAEVEPIVNSLLIW